MIEFFTSSIFGNIVGFISLLAGLIGIWITVKTMKSAKRIEKEIKYEKEKAIDKMRFNYDKREYTKTLETKRNAAKKDQLITYNLCSSIISMFHDLVGFDNVISDNDMKIINEQKRLLQELLKSLQASTSEPYENYKLWEEFDKIVSTVINILKGGKYEL